MDKWVVKTYLNTSWDSKITLVLWGNAYNEYHIVIGYVFIVLLV